MEANLKALSIKIRKKEREFIKNLITRLLMLENTKTICLMDWERIHGKMEEYMKAIGKQVKCTVEEDISGRMGNIMMENMLKIKKKGKEHLYGQMGKNMWEAGEEESNMDKV